MKSAVLFDLGGTLVQYYGRSEIPQVLKEAITAVCDYLGQKGLLQVSEEEMWKRAEEEDYEASDYRVRPATQRLMRIFQLDERACSAALLAAMCRSFLGPVFGRARRYDDAIPVLQQLRSDGCKVAIVSNTAWGTPGDLWREEVVRHGLDGLVDVTVFCSDVGWRKPAPQIFAYTLEKLGVGSEECIFIGDDPRWDFVGPRSVGIAAILLDRGGTLQGVTEERVRDLYEFYDGIWEVQS
jgi:putative hydrolase of the HAD superfamily